VLHLHALRERLMPCWRAVAGAGANCFNFCQRGQSSICRLGHRGHFIVAEGPGRRRLPGSRVARGQHELAVHHLGRRLHRRENNCTARPGRLLLHRPPRFGHTRNGRPRCTPVIPVE
jgi:hypothetical protein